MENRAANRYLGKVKRRLMCSRAHRERLLGRCREMVTGYLEETPDADYARLTAAFGTPEECAGELLASLDAAVVAVARERRKFLHIGAVVSVLACLVLVCVYWYAQYNAAKNITVVVEYPPTYTTEEAHKEQIEQARIENQGRPDGWHTTLEEDD